MALESTPRVCFEVEKIIGISSDGSYQVQWAPAWVSKFHLVGCEHLIQKFLQEQSQNLTEKDTSVEKSNQINKQNCTPSISSTSGDSTSTANEITKQCNTFHPNETEMARPTSASTPTVSRDRDTTYLDQQPDLLQPTCTGEPIKIEVLDDEPSESQTRDTLDININEEDSYSWNANNYDNNGTRTQNKEELPEMEQEYHYENDAHNTESQLSTTQNTDYMPNLRDTRNLERPNDTVTQLYSCNQCSKSFPDPTQLTLHIRSHTQEKSWTCPYCEYSSSWKGNLERHVRLHTGEKPFKCESCGKYFRNVGNRNNHAKRCVNMSLQTHL